MYSRFGTVPACDGQSDRQTDGRTHDDSIYRASIASRGKTYFLSSQSWRTAAVLNSRKPLWHYTHNKILHNNAQCQITRVQLIFTKGRIAGGIFFTVGYICNVTSTSWQYCNPLQQWRCGTVIVFFAAYNAAVNDNAFHWAGQSQNCPVSWVSRPYLIHGSLGPRKSAQKPISIGSAVFAGLTNVTNRYTHAQTHRPRYFVCSNRPHLAVAAMPPKIAHMTL